METNWKLVYSSNLDLTAQFIAGHLEASDIPTNILSQVDSNITFTVGDLAIAKVYVPEAYVARALALIRDVENTSDNDDEPFDAER